MHTKYHFIFLLLLLLPSVSKAQEKWKIVEDTSFIEPYARNKGKNAEMIGKMNFDSCTYHDKLINHLAKLDTVSEIDGQYKVNAIWGTDTLCCTVYNTQRLVRSIRDNRKANIVRVESRIPPHSTFEALVEDMDETEIALLIDSMYRCKSKYDVLHNSLQTCISYAWECLFRTNGIDPEPVCFTRSVYPHMWQGDPFMDTFFTKGESYLVRKTNMKKVLLPEKSVLAFYDKDNSLLHAIFYMNHRIYSKNGLFPYTTYPNLTEVLKRYEPYKITVYTINNRLFEDKTNKRD